MTVLFDRDFGRVWTDGKTPCIEAIVVRVPILEELNELAEKQLSLIRELSVKFGSVYSILNMSLCPPAPTRVVLNYIVRILPSQFEAGLTHKAVVLPTAGRSLSVLVKAFISIKEQPVSLHASHEEARALINQRWKEYKSKKAGPLFGL